MHRFLEVDGVEDFDAVAVFLEGHAAVEDDIALRISDNVGAMHLKQVWLEPIARLAGTRAADHQHIFVPGILGILRTVGHGQPLCFRENNVLRKGWIFKGSNVFWGAPTGAAVFHVVAILFRIVPLEIDGQSQQAAAYSAEYQILGVTAGPRGLKRGSQHGKKAHGVSGKVGAAGDAPGQGELGGEQSDEQIGNAEN